MNKLLCTISVLLLLGSGVVPHATELSVEVAFSSGEIETIRAYFREHELESTRHKGRKTLPPGVARNLQRGKPLPPGIAKQVLPGGLIERLPPVHPGYERIIVDGRILLVEIATQIIHDVLSDAILR